MQIKVEMNIYYFNDIYKGKERIKEKNWESWKNERKKENKRKKEFLLVRDDSYIRGGKPFYRFSKWFLLILIIMLN